MKEEKGGVLHILFLFIGIALLALGIFYFVTDRTEILDENVENPYVIIRDDDNKKNSEKEKSTTISQISITSNVESSILLKNGSTVKLELSNRPNVKDPKYGGKFFKYNDKAVFGLGDYDKCSNFFLYDNTIIAYCTNTKTNYSFIYALNENGEVYYSNSIKENEIDLKIKNINLTNNKLIVYASYVDNIKVILDDKELNLCDSHELSESKIDSNYLAEAEYELKVSNSEIKYETVSKKRTIGQFVAERCKTVE